MSLVFTWGRPKEDDVITTFDSSRYLTVEGGTLQIASVGPKDSGRLQCKVSYHDDKGKIKEKIYTYVIEGMRYEEKK